MQHCYKLFKGAPQKLILDPSTVQIRRTAWDYDNTDWPSWNIELPARHYPQWTMTIWNHSRCSVYFLKRSISVVKSTSPWRSYVNTGSLFDQKTYLYSLRTFKRLKFSRYKRQSDTCNHQKLRERKLIFDESLIWCQRRTAGYTESLRIWTPRRV